MRCQATRRKRFPPDATATLPSRSARASCWRKSKPSLPDGARDLHDPPVILAVDDTPENLGLRGMRRGANGYGVETAVDGEEALARTRALRPDLILLDVMMPKLDGIA